MQTEAKEDVNHDRRINFQEILTLAELIKSYSSGKWHTQTPVISSHTRLEVNAFPHFGLQLQIPMSDSPNCVQ